MNKTKPKPKPPSLNCVKYIFYMNELTSQMDLHIEIGILRKHHCLYRIKVDWSVVTGHPYTLVVNLIILLVTIN